LIKVDTLRGADIMRLPTPITTAVCGLPDLQEVEVWKTNAPNSDLFEYRVFKANQTLPCVRICLSDCA
jgi:hypothetical protein